MNLSAITVADIVAIASAVVAIFQAKAAQKERLKVERMHEEMSKAQRKISRDVGLENARKAGRLHIEWDGGHELKITNPGPEAIESLTVWSSAMENSTTVLRFLDPMEPAVIKLSQRVSSRTFTFDEVILSWTPSSTNEKRQREIRQKWRFIDAD
ncbi:hypothetical protein QVA66_03775 [Staphylococcus chromogenes]|nr:hypothetical protein [Staphylococcus chromogenes]